MTDHPSSDELSAFCRGQLSPARARAVARHLVLGACQQCLASVPARIHLRFGSPSPPVELTQEEDAAYDAAMERALQTAVVHARELDRRETRTRKAAATVVSDGLEALTRLPRRMGNLDRIKAFLDRSWSVRHENPALMAQLAQLAVHQARQLDVRRYGIHQVFDLQGRAWAELGNAYRVMDQLDLAAVTLGKAREFVEQGTGDEALLARLREVEASLAADRRQFGNASNLLLEVQAFHQRNGDEHLVGRILILRGLYSGYAGEPERAIDLLREGLSLVDQERDPSVVYSAVHNQFLFLIDCGLYQEARRFRFENSQILKNNGGRLNQARFRWLEGRMDLGMRNYERAEMTLREVKHEMEEVGRSYVAAVASLDLAVALLAQSRPAEAEQVTLAASEVFRRLRIHREGLMALTVLRAAFKMGQATVELLRNVAAFFRRLENDPNPRFDGPLL
ncbi:MAG TPA: hypothetical protein VIA62_04540 [Thermoanaerobaculia bacterium]|nr:hypothetical protein [Thermoanaerobaculia bacterium]